LKYEEGTGPGVEYKMRTTFFHHLPSRWYYVPGYLCREARQKREKREKRKQKDLSLKSLISSGTHRAEQGIPCQ
ncbi:hypothetical protein ACQP3F_32245, partial [Escherichia coli]